MKEVREPGRWAAYAEVGSLVGALSPVQAAIVYRLAEGPHTVTELVDALGHRLRLLDCNLRPLPAAA